MLDCALGFFPCYFLFGCKGVIHKQPCVTSTGTLKAAKAGTKRPMHRAIKPKTATQTNRGEKQAS